MVLEVRQQEVFTRQGLFQLYNREEYSQAACPQNLGEAVARAFDTLAITAAAVIFGRLRLVCLIRVSGFRHFSTVTIRHLIIGRHFLMCGHRSRMERSMRNGGHRCHNEGQNHKKTDPAAYHHISIVNRIKVCLQIQFFGNQGLRFNRCPKERQLDNYTPLEYIIPL